MFKKFNFDFEFPKRLQSSSLFNKNPPYFLILRQTACIHLAHFYLMKNSAKVLGIVRNRSLNIKCIIPAFFGGRLAPKSRPPKN
jgi:hypothetical protein